MIMCDYCSEWYHFDCIGIQVVLAESIDSYKCHHCLDKGTDERMYEEGTIYTIDIIANLFTIETPKRRMFKLVFGDKIEVHNAYL